MSSNSNEITEEGVSGDSGSTKNAKKVPQFFDANLNQQRTNVSNSVAELSRPQFAQTMTFTEDVQNELHDKIRAAQFPVSIKFLMWQDSNIGNYIEFKIEVTYHEGHENAGQRQSLISPHASANSDAFQGSN